MQSACPKCGFTYRWDGTVCGHCCSPSPPAPPRRSSEVAPALWRVIAWVIGLVAFGTVGWYQGRLWSFDRGAASSWWIIAAVGLAFCIASAAILSARISWWAKLLGWLGTAFLYVNAWGVLYVGTCIGDGKGFGVG